MSLRSSLLILLVVSMVLLAGCSSSQPRTTRTTELPSEDGDGWTVTITRIVDGDTVEFEYRNGTEDTARLLGVDTPEVHTTNDPAEFEGVPTDDSGASCLRDWGHRASEFAETELVGERVTLVLDPNEGPRDRYDRLLAYIRHDGKLFNFQLVAQGYARVYDSDFTKRDRFYSAESNAQREKTGLWKCRNGKVGGRTTAGRTDGTTDLSIVRIHADAVDNDHDNLNDEYIVLKNSGNDALDVSGWSVADDAGHSYLVPSRVSLEPGETVTLYTGNGSDSTSELYWGSDSAVWNNGGDTIIVRDTDGDEMIRRTYSG